MHDGRLRIRIAAPPIDGRANDALRAFVAQRLGVPRASVTVAQGAGARLKRIAVDARLSADEVAARLAG